MHCAAFHRYQPFFIFHIRDKFCCGRQHFDWVCSVHCARLYTCGNWQYWTKWVGGMRNAWRVLTPLCVTTTAVDSACRINHFRGRAARFRGWKCRRLGAQADGSNLGDGGGCAQQVGQPPSESMSFTFSFNFVTCCFPQNRLLQHYITDYSKVAST